MSGQKTGRRRRSSSLIYQEPPESIEHMSDQSALPNLNANWVNAKGGFIFNTRGHSGGTPDISPHEQHAVMVLRSAENMQHDPAFWTYLVFL